MTSIRQSNCKSLYTLFTTQSVFHLSLTQSSAYPTKLPDSLSMSTSTNQFLNSKSNLHIDMGGYINFLWKNEILHSLNVTVTKNLPSSILHKKKLLTSPQDYLLPFLTVFHLLFSLHLPRTFWLTLFQVFLMQHKRKKANNTALRQAVKFMP